MSALGTLKLYDHINWVVHDIIFTYDVNIEVTQVFFFFFPSSTVHLVSCYDLFADLLIEFKCTLRIFECIYDSKDLSYVVTSFVLVYQDFPWENILALLFFLINLYCCTRIEACECWLTVMWIWSHFFFSLLHLKRKQNLWKNLLSLRTHIWIFFLHFFILPVIFQQSGKKNSANTFHNKFCKQKSTTDCKLKARKCTSGRIVSDQLRCCGWAEYTTNICIASLLLTVSQMETHIIGCNMLWSWNEWT